MLSTQLCNLESRMRKQANLKRPTETKENNSKRVKYDDPSGKPLYTKDSLPTNMFHLGGDNYVCIVFFLSHTRVHIRQFTTDEEGFLHPSKNGVSISPAVWHAFQRNSHNFSGQFLIVDKDLCVSRETKQGENFYTFQRMFQRKNLSFQFLPENVVLTGAEMANMQNIFPNIRVQVKEALIKNTLQYFVVAELENAGTIMDLFSEFHELANLTHSLTQLLAKAMSLKIAELFYCFPCVANYPLSDLHECISMSASEKFENYFEPSFYQLDWRQLAKDFYQENVSEFPLVPMDVFFETLDISDVLQEVKKMYVDNVLFV